MGGLDFRLKKTEVLEHINGRENKKKMKKIYLTIFKKSSFVDRNQSFRTSASFEDRNASNFMFIYTTWPRSIGRIDPVDPADPCNGTRRSGGSDRLARPKTAIQIDPIWRTPEQRIDDVFLYE